MDSGLAVIVGAAIALIGSAVIPWIRESTLERNRARSRRREEIAAAIRDVIEIANRGMAGLDWKQYVAAAEVARAKLGLLLSKQESDIDEMVDIALTHAVAGEERKTDIAAVVQLCTELPRWYRGERGAAEALAAVKEAIASAEFRNPPPSGESPS